MDSKPDTKPAPKPAFTVGDISVAATDTIYPGRDGSRSVQVVTARVPIGIGTLDVAVYARLTLAGDLSFDVSLPRKGVNLNPDVKDAIKAVASHGIGSWSGWQAAADRAEAILTAPAKVKADKLSNPLGGKSGIKQAVESTVKA